MELKPFSDELGSLFESNRSYALWWDCLFMSLGALSALLDKHVWHPAEGYYILLALVIMDYLLGMRIAWIRNTFETRKAFRISYKILSYTLLLFFAHNLSKYEKLLFWLPDAVFLPIVLMLFVSVIKNLSLLGYLPAKIARILYQKIDIYKNSNSESK